MPDSETHTTAAVATGDASDGPAARGGDAGAPGKETADDALSRLRASRAGLSSAEAAQRLAEVGPNAIPDKRRSLLAELLAFFWGPIPWMIEVALVLSAILQHWPDVIIIGILLVFNAGIGFWQQHTAADAVAALKRQLALRATALRDAEWRDIDAARLVPGDVVRVRLGDIVPADLILLDGDYLRVDQSALTGESLPVDKRSGDSAYSGSVAAQGSMTAVVTATGVSTYFGKTTRLVASARSTSHFQQAVLAIGNYLIWLSLGLVAVLVVVELLRHASPLTLVQFALILTVAAIPVAMPAVLSVTMAVGAMALSKMKAIVTRLESIEEMAGVDVLCSDKTGTLTQNRLSLGDPVVGDASDAAAVILAAALTCEIGTQDAIDRAVLAAAGGADALRGYAQARLVPFDPVSKRTEAEVTHDGTRFSVTKGAPQVVLQLCEPQGDGATLEPSLQRAHVAVEKLAAEGYRTLGVARREAGGRWRFLGLLPLSDPPREDSAETIRRAEEHGVEVKMVTGDNTAIATQIATRLGLGRHIEAAGSVASDGDDGKLSPALAERIEKVDGFAEVFPEHKYAIVKALQARGHIVGMTGDGVNDAPALKQADAGIAVAGATDAARSAADLVLTAPGLSVIVNAIEQARVIFERMNSYAIYRITETIRIVLFVVAAMLAFNFYPITAILIILLALFNDVPIMTIAIDNTAVDPHPVRWEMRRVLSVSTMLGTVGVLETFLMLVLAKTWMGLDIAQIQTLIFLKLAVAGHLTLFVARTAGRFWKRPWPARSMLGAAIGTKALATLLVAFGLGLIAPISWAWIGFVWAYCLIWIFIEDGAKLGVYRYLDRRRQALPAPASADTKAGGKATLPAPPMGHLTRAMEDAVERRRGFGRGASLRELAQGYKQATEVLAAEIAQGCTNLLSPGTGAARRDQLTLSMGMESERPLIAAVMALAPAVSAAGDAVAMAAPAGGDRTARALVVAESVTDLGGEALQVLDERRRGPYLALEFAHHVALITHRATMLPTTQCLLTPPLPWDSHPVPPGEWSRLASELHLRVEGARGRDEVEVPSEQRVSTAAACRDAASHAMRAYTALPGRHAEARPKARLLRSLAFASLYCGLAALRDQGAAPGGGGPAPSRVSPAVAAR